MKFALQGRGLSALQHRWHALCKALRDLDVSKVPGAKAVGIGTAGVSRLCSAQRSSDGDRDRAATFFDVTSIVIERFSAAGYVAGDFNK